MAQDESSSNIDWHFWMEKLYPTPAARLDWQPKSLDEIKADCIVCFDTTFLFYCLELSKGALEDQFKVADRLSSKLRLFIPIHVVREFIDSKHRNQSQLTDKLKERVRRFRDAETGLVAETFGILSEKPGKEFLETVKKAKADLGFIREKLEKGSDVALLFADRCNQIADHFQGTVYDPEFASADKIEITQDHAMRLDHKRGPGFEDSDKSDRGVGDLIIWKTALALGQRHKKHMCFVSNDQKADWFYQYDKGPFSPRAELLYEYAAVSDLKTVHFMKTSDFAKAFGAGVEAVEEIKRIEERNEMNETVNAAMEAYRQTDKFKHQMALSGLRDRRVSLEGQMAEKRARGEDIRRENREYWGTLGAIQHYEALLRGPK
jgi:PIN like domain